jgi:hypothetical protein
MAALTIQQFNKAGELTKELDINADCDNRLLISIYDPEGKQIYSIWLNISETKQVLHYVRDYVNS